VLRLHVGMEISRFKVLNETRAGPPYLSNLNA
jgi:hypothetical protein